MSSYIIGREALKAGKIEGVRADILDLLDLPLQEEVYIVNCDVGKLICTNVGFPIYLRKCNIEVLVAIPPIPNVINLSSKIKRMFGEFEIDFDSNKRLVPPPALSNEDLNKLMRVSIDNLYRNEEMHMSTDYILNKYFAWCEDKQRQSIRELLSRR